ncbi:MAG: hypothetical protein ACE5GM_10050 [bacterium]
MKNQGLFFCSLSLFLYEIVIIRIFSALYHYELLFILISLAVFGTGIGGIIYDRYQPHFNPPGGPFPQRLLVSFAFSFNFSGILILKYFEYLTVYGAAVLSVIPFLLGGMILATYYSHWPDECERHYFNDLLGGVSGCLLSLVIINLCGVPHSILVIGMFASVIPSRLRKDFPYYREISTVPLNLLIVMGIAFSLFFPLTVSQSRLKLTDTPLGHTLSYPRAKTELLDSLWGLYSRCDLVKIISGKTDRLEIFINGGTQASMPKAADSPQELKALKQDITYLPYLLGKPDKVLVLGAGGGRDVYMALLAGAGRVEAVEINRGVIELARRQRNGDIFGNRRVNWVAEDGRSYIMRTRDRFDNIVLSLSSTLAFSDSLGTSQLENYLYTQEAFDLYLSHLTPKGMVSVFVDYPELLEKFVLTMLNSYKSKGIIPSDAMKHIAAFKTKSWSGYSYGLIFKAASFTETESDSLKKSLDDFGLKPLFIPYYQSDTDFSKISGGKISPESYRKNSLVDISPSTDNKPFFLEGVMKYHIKMAFLLLILLLVLFKLVIIRFINYFKQFLNAPHKLAIESGYTSLSGFLPYFFSVGVGFMLIEITMMKLFSYYLQYPQLNMVIVLASILLGSGLGGLYSRRIVSGDSGKLLRVILGIVPLTLLTGLSLPYLISGTVQAPLIIRIFLVILAVLPLSFLMGIPFPQGIRLAKQMFFTREIGWFWGINGLAAVIGSVLSITLSLIWGFRSAFLMAAVFYLIAGYSAHRLTHFKQGLT